MRYTVSIRRSFTVDVQVEADSPEDAVKQVDRRDFPLPALDQWSGMKDWDYTVHDENGNDLGDADSAAELHDLRDEFGALHEQDAATLAAWEGTTGSDD